MITVFKKRRVGSCAPYERERALEEEIGPNNQGIVAQLRSRG